MIMGLYRFIYKLADGDKKNTDGKTYTLEEIRKIDKKLDKHKKPGFKSWIVRVNKDGD
jgi:hypothetical protein